MISYLWVGSLMSIAILGNASFALASMDSLSLLYEIITGKHNLLFGPLKNFDNLYVDTVSPISVDHFHTIS